MSELSEEEIIKNYNSILNNAKANWIYEDYEILANFLDLYQKEKELSSIRFKNLVKIQEEKDKIYNEGYFQGVRDERDNTEEHIKKVIQGLDKNIASVNDNLSENYKYAKKMLQELLEERN